MPCESALADNAKYRFEHEFDEYSFRTLHVESLAGRTRQTPLNAIELYKNNGRGLFWLLFQKG